MYKSSQNPRASKKSTTINQTVLSSSQCEVCFVHVVKPEQDKRFNFISCRGCHRICHHYCYNTTIQQNQFLCDLCQDKQSYSTKNNNTKLQNCIVCGNEGLLKRVSHNQYAHLICALFYLDPSVSSYQTLQIIKCESVDQKRQNSQCKICHKFSKYVESCQHIGCREKAHIFCCLKKYTETQDCYESSFFLKEDKTKPINILACSKHLKICQCNKEIQDNQITCDQCSLWYHEKCVNMNSKKVRQSDKFYCQYCKQWNSKQKQNVDLTMNKYPRFHLYDFLTILRSYQNTKRSQSIKIIQMFPFKRQNIELSSDNDLLHQMNQLVSQLILQTNAQDMFSIQINELFFIKLCKHFDIKFDKNSKSKKKLSRQNSNKDVKTTVKQLHELLKNVKPENQEDKAFLSDFNNIINKPKDYAFHVSLIIKSASNKLKYSSQTAVQIYQQAVSSIIKLKSKCNMKALNLQDSNKLNTLHFVIETETDNQINQISHYYSLFNLVKLYGEYYANSKSHIDFNNSESKNIFSYTILPEYKRLPNKFKQLFNNICQLNVVEAQIQQNRKKETNLIHNWLNRSSIPLEQYQKIQHKLAQFNKNSRVNKFKRQRLEIYGIVSILDKCLSLYPQYDVIRFMNQSVNQLQRNFILKISPLKLIKYTNYLYQHSLISKLVQQVQQSYRILGLISLSPKSYIQMINYLENYLIQFYRNGMIIGINIFDVTCSLFQIPEIQPLFKSFLSKGIKILLEGRNINFIEGEYVQKWNKCIKFLDVDYQNKSDMLIKQQEYKKWHQKYMLNIDKNIIPYLGDQLKVPLLLKLIEEATNVSIQKDLRITKFLKVFKMIQIWASISLKLFDILRNKATPGAIKQMVQILKQAKYPQQLGYAKQLFSLFNKIQQFQPTLNKFKKKTQQQDLDISSQLSVVQSKLTMNQHKKIIKQLNQSPIDYSFELGDIETQLNLFKQKKEQTQQLIKINNLEDLNKLMKYFLFDTAFCYDGFKQLRNKVRTLQCKLIPKTLKEYHRLRFWGGQNVNQLITNCKNKLDNYNRLEQICVSLSNGDRKQFCTVSQLQNISKHLFEIEPKKKTISNWIKNFKQLDRKVSQIFERNSKYYKIQTIVSYIQTYNNIPISSDYYERLVIKRKQMQGIERQFKKYEQIIRNEVMQIQQFIDDLNDLLSFVHRQKILIPQYNYIIKEVETYFSLLNQTPIGHDEYIDYLTKCKKLDQKYMTKDIWLNRFSYFESNKHFISESLNRQQAKLYVFEGTELLNIDTENKITIQEIQEMQKIMLTKQNQGISLKRQRQSDEFDDDEQESIGDQDEDDDQDDEGLQQESKQQQILIDDD